MIRVRKGPEPRTLRRRGRDERDRLCAARDADPDTYADGTQKFAFDSGIYGADDVKAALIEAQHGKCCFCEAKITHIAYGDVEHFRPKAAWTQDVGDPLQRPGYYWLAYDWGNLFFSCQLCNQRHKRNLFPLVDPATRARSHHDDVADEEPLFVDPGEDPEAHVGFRQEVPFGRSASGAVTVSALRLDRPALMEARREQLTPILELVEAHRVLSRIEAPSARESTLVQKIEGRIRAVQAATHPYASMFRCALGHLV